MDFPIEIKTPAKRRCHSKELKARVLEETLQPGVSVAAVAQRHNLNANLIHKWRRAAECGIAATSVQPAFLALPVARTSEATSRAEVRVEISNTRRTVNVFWPSDQPSSLADFIKILS
jgi:transposase-like protein